MYVKYLSANKGELKDLYFDLRRKIIKNLEGRAMDSLFGTEASEIIKYEATRDDLIKDIVRMLSKPLTCSKDLPTDLAGAIKILEVYEKNLRRKIFGNNF